MIRALFTSATGMNAQSTVIDNTANNFEGWYVDDVQVGPLTNPDFYSLTLQAGDTLSASLKQAQKSPNKDCSRV